MVRRRGAPTMLPTVRTAKEAKAIGKCQDCHSYQEPGWCLRNKRWCYIVRPSCSKGGSI